MSWRCAGMSVQPDSSANVGGRGGRSHYDRSPFHARISQ